ncbi:MAG TPA: gamma-glutamyl-gamma-aminobutyrate hydrolase family protein [Candidatus Mcinerneyibacterium sp.]|nr:gamma-glutamyl-gamma-aminobutyrate hydrolase family protein [Candidatus Mcinerneyibacterium sp.]
MKNPVIGITSSLMFMNNQYRFPEYKRIYINEDYVRAIENSGGIPIIIPIDSKQSNINYYLSKINGLLLTGGVDINPEHYGEKPHEKIGKIINERDSLDFTLLEKALNKKIPVLGICRGMQLINVYFGGSLYQDKSLNKKFTLNHYQNNPEPSTLGHSVNIKGKTKLHGIVKNTNFKVNSYHHQFIKRIGTKLKISAISSDGSIEGLESNNSQFIIGIQWHPERIYNNSKESKLIFDKLIDKSGRNL